MSSEYRGSSGNGNPFEQLPNMMQPAPEMFVRMMHPVWSANASLMQLQSKMWHTAADASRELCGFIGKRLEKDAQFLQNLQDTENPQAFMDKCTQFSRSMAEDYQEEFSELSKLSSKAAGGASDIMREATERMSNSAEQATKEMQSQAENVTEEMQSEAHQASENAERAAHS